MLFEDVVAAVLLGPPAPLFAAVAVLMFAPVAVAELLVFEDVVLPKALATDNDAESDKNGLNVNN